MGNSKSPKGLIIGSAIGFAVGATFGMLLSGISFHGSTSRKVNPLAAIGGGLVVGLVGGMIGGSIDGGSRERVTLHLYDMSINEAKEKINNIIKFYGN